MARRPFKNGKGAASPGNGAEPVDYGPLDQWLGFNLRLAQTASFASFARLSKEVGERPGRMAMLRLIAQNPGISQTALSRANGRDKSTLTPLLTDFARRGLVRRTRTRNDKRTYRLTLTPAGERLLAQLHACAQVHERQLDEVIGPRDRVRFLAILRKIAAEMA